MPIAENRAVVPLDGRVDDFRRGAVVYVALRVCFAEDFVEGKLLFLAIVSFRVFQRHTPRQNVHLHDSLPAFTELLAEQRPAPHHNLHVVRAGHLGYVWWGGMFFFFFNLADGETFAQNTKDAALRPFSILYNARFCARNDDHTAVGLPYLPPPVTVRPGHFSGSPRRADGVCGSRDDEVPKKSAVVIKQKTRRIISVNEIIRHPFERRPHRAPRGLAAPWFRSRPRAGWWSVGSGWTEPRLGRR